MRVKFENIKSPRERELAKLAIESVLNMNLETENLTIIFQNHSIEYGVQGQAQYCNHEGSIHYIVWIRLNDERLQTLLHELIHVMDYQDVAVRLAAQQMNEAEWDSMIHHNMASRVEHWMNQLN